MNLLSFIDRFSYKQILSVAILLALLFALPTTIWLVNQQTKLYSSAHKENLPPGYFVESEPFGAPNPNPPKIEGIRPFLGKVDDVVLISGKDFGQNPQNRKILFGGVLADEKDILRWHNDLIEVMVPLGAVSGLVTVVDVDKQDTFGLPFTVYSPQTKTRVFWQGNNLAMESGFDVSRANVVLANGQSQEKQIGEKQSITVLWENFPREIVNLSLYDTSGQLLPYFVNPTDFGF